MSGVIVAPVENTKRLAIAITYGPLTTGQVLRRAADQVLPSPFTVRCVKPRGERRSWNGLVRDFEVSGRAWDVEAAGLVQSFCIYVIIITGKQVCISHTQKTRNIELLTLSNGYARYSSCSWSLRLLRITRLTN